MNTGKLFLFLVAIILIGITEALKCRNNDGPSEEKMKRVARSCMKKVSNVQDGDDSSDYYEDQGGFDRGNNSQKRGRDQLGEWRHSRVLSRDDYGRQRYNNHFGNLRNPGTSERHQHQVNSGPNRHSNDKISYGNRGNQNDKSCVVHCFFEELNMLNNQDFPDKHKVTYVITRDIRDNELREFYADSIQECFRFIEAERQRDKCQFSKDLINCMAEYARANCEDWYNHTMIFNN